MVKRLPPTERDPGETSAPLVFFTREAWRRLWRAKRTSSVAVAMIAIALFILGFFMLIAENLSHTIGQWEGAAKVTVYLKNDATPTQVAAVSAWLRGNPNLARHELVTKETALRRFHANFSSMSGLLDQLDENPFPVSFDIDVPREIAQQQAIQTDLSALKRQAAVDDVQFDWAWIARVKNVVRLLNLIGVVAGGILAIAAAFTTANVIRLSLVLYREEISIMRLVGANEAMIRGPFLIQGVMQGLIGGVVAVVTLLLAYVGSRELLQSAPSLLWNFLFVGFLPWPKIGWLLLGGTLAGLIGSWISLLDFREEEAA